MGTQSGRGATHGDQEAGRRRRMMGAVPSHGEPATVAVDDVLQDRGGDPAGFVSALADSGSSVRARVVSRLQQQHGNARVQRLLTQAAATSLAVQREPPAAPAAQPAAPTGQSATPAAQPAAPAGDPFRAAMWDAGVVKPLHDAQQHLKATHPSKPDLSAALADVNSAGNVAQSTANASASGTDATVAASAATLAGNLNAAGAELEVLVGTKFDAPHVKGLLARQEGNAQSIEQKVASSPAPSAPAPQPTP